MFRRHDVEGEFVVTSVVVHDISDGLRTLRVTGRLTDGRDEGSVTTSRVVRVADDDPSPGDRVPATWRRGRPRRHRIRWTAGWWWTAALAQRDARATALGLDPAVLSRGPDVCGGATGAAAFTYWWTNAAPLPDGAAPVEVAEAEQLLRRGEPAEATVLAIDYLHLAPDVEVPKGGSIANVALEVRRREAGSYRTLARFGFRSAERRRQIGYVDAVVPVRLDPQNPSRVTLDRPRLPPTSS